MRPDLAPKTRAQIEEANSRRRLFQIGMQDDVAETFMASALDRLVHNMKPTPLDACVLVEWPPEPLERMRRWYGDDGAFDRVLDYRRRLRIALEAAGHTFSAQG